MTPWSFFNRVKLNSLIANKSQGVLRALGGLLTLNGEEFFADKGIDVTKEKTFANDKAAVEPAVAQTSERDQGTPAGAGPQNAGPTGHALGQNSPLDAARAGNPAALRGIHSMGPGAAMAALHPQASADKPGQSGQHAAPVYEPIDPGIAAQFKVATGEDVAGVLIAENPELEKEGKRGVALAGECIEVLPGMKSDAKLCAHELVHIVQQRGPTKAKSAKPTTKTPTDPEREAVEGARAITSGQPFEIKVSSSEARLYDGDEDYAFEDQCGPQGDTGGGELCNQDNVSNIKRSCEDAGMEQGIEAETHSTIKVEKSCIGIENRHRILQHMMQLECIRSELQALLDLQSTEVYFDEEHQKKIEVYIKAIDEALVVSGQLLEAAEEECVEGHERHEQAVKDIEEAPKELSSGDELLAASSAAGVMVQSVTNWLPMPQVKMGGVVVRVALVAVPFAVNEILKMMNDSRPALEPYLEKSVALSVRAGQLFRDIIARVRPLGEPIPFDLEDILKIDIPKIEPKGEPRPNPPPEPPRPEPPQGPTPEIWWLLGLVSAMGGIAVENLQTLMQKLGGGGGGRNEDHPGYVVQCELKDPESTDVSGETASSEKESQAQEVVDSCQGSEDQHEESDKDVEPCKIEACNKFGIIAPTSALEEMTLFERIESCSLPKPKSDSPISEGTIVEPNEQVIFTDRALSYYNVTVYSGHTTSKKECVGAIDERVFLEQPRPLKNDDPHREDPNSWLNCKTEDPNLKKNNPDRYSNYKTEDSSCLDDTNMCPQSSEYMQDSECQIEGDTSCVAPETNCNSDESSQYPESCRRTEHTYNNAQYPLDNNAPRMKGIYPQMYKKFEGNPYDNRDPKPSDVVQGVISDCPLMAVLMSFAQYDNGSVLYDILPNTDGPEFTVNLLMFDRGNLVNKYKVPVDAYLVVDPETGERLYATVELDQSGNKIMDTPLWPALIEKAVAKNLGGDFEQLNWGRGSEFYMEMMLDKLPSVYRFPDDILEFEMFLNNRKNDSPLTLTARKDLVRGNNFQLTADHVYYLNSFVDGELELRNPWGIDHPPSIKVEKLANAFDRASTINPK